MLHPKKVGTLPPVDPGGEEKQTNEIKMIKPLLESIDIKGKTISTDALHTQTDLADYLVDEREADYVFQVKGNQKTLLNDISLYFEKEIKKREPDAEITDPPDHGRIETRRIWITDELNGYLNFPHVRQAFVIERIVIDKKTGKERVDKLSTSKNTLRDKRLSYGITSKPKEKANALSILKTVRNHWSIENSCHYIIDWNYDEDRSRISKEFGPQNVTRLRRFAVGLLKSKKVKNVAQKTRKLNYNTRAVLDYLRLTSNSQRSALTEKAG